LFIKVATVVVKAIIAGFTAVDWSKLKVLVSWIKLPEKKVKPEPIKKELTINQRASERKLCILMIRDTKSENFDGFYSKTKFLVLTREEVEELYNQYMPMVLKARERAKLRKEQIRQQLIFWTNFSRVFIKWTMNILYVGLVIGLAYGLFAIAGPV
jgi:ABC-type bacteriocin/lantibiotic exporter with double-glycine peptidase domain